MVRVVPVDQPLEPKRVGFLLGEIEVPEDFNEMGKDEIEAMFGGAE